MICSACGKEINLEPRNDNAEKHPLYKCRHCGSPVKPGPDHGKAVERYVHKWE